MKKIGYLLALLFLLATPALADNIQITEGAGKTVAFDTISAVNYQRMKLIFGADNANSGDVSTSNAFPVQLRSSGGTEIGTSAAPIQCSLANTATNATAVKVDGSAVTQPVSGTFWQATQPVSIASVPSHAVTNAGTFAVQAAQSGTWTVQPGNTANTTPWLVNTENSSSFLSLDLDESEEEVKSTAAVLRGYYYYNNATSVRFIKLYNDTAVNVTVGTTAPQLVFPIPPGSAANITLPNIPFTTALTAACTTGVANNDTGAPAANDCVVDLYYK